jgi:hypothetical protein
MKPAFHYFFCAAAITFIATSSAKPSRQETVDWLTGKLSHYSTSTNSTLTGLGDVAVATLTWRITAFNVDDGMLHLRKEISYSNGLNDEITDMTASLNELSSQCSVEEAKPIHVGDATRAWDPTVYYVVLSTSAPDKIKCETWLHGERHRYSNPSQIRIEFTDRQLADRVSKAFEHLIKLSGGRDEVF